VNTAHPDFLNGNRAMTMANEKLNPPAQPALDTKGRTVSQAVVANQNLNSAVNLDDGGFFGSFFNTKKKKAAALMEPPPPILKASGTLSEREHMETEVIKLLITSYFNIVKRTVIDMVPKAVMLKLVTQAKEELQRELLKELYRSEVLEDVLTESEATQNRRKECKKMIEALQKSDEIVAGV